MSNCYIQTHDGADGTRNCKIMQKQTPQDKKMPKIKHKETKHKFKIKI